MRRRWLQDSARGLALGVQFGHLERGTRRDLCPEGGYRAQPRVSTLGTLKINESALKGREAGLIKLAPIAAQKLECAIETCYIWTYFPIVSTFDLPPLQGESLWALVPRVETLG
jgi:hypothetical protein